MSFGAVNDNLPGRILTTAQMVSRQLTKLAMKFEIPEIERKTS